MANSRKEAQCLYDCIGEDSQELSFSTGDIIINITETQDAGWYFGTLKRTGQKGLFPGNYGF
jgi:hypothetical protein